MKEVEELAGRLARVQGGKTVNKNTERMYGARRTLRRVWTVHVILNLLKSVELLQRVQRRKLNLRSNQGRCEDARAFGSYDGAARRCVW